MGESQYTHNISSLIDVHFIAHKKSRWPFSLFLESPAPTFLPLTAVPGIFSSYRLLFCRTRSRDVLRLLRARFTRLSTRTWTRITLCDVCTSTLHLQSRLLLNRAPPSRLLCESSQQHLAVFRRRATRSSATRSIDCGTRLGIKLRAYISACTSPSTGC